MLIGGIVLGLILGLLVGGRLEHLASIRLRYMPLLFVAVIIRFGTELLLGQGVGVVDTLRMPLYALSYGLLLFALWKNRTYPGLALAFVGVAANAIAIVANGGRMPVWDMAFDASGLQGGINSVLHFELSTQDSTEFLLHLGPLGDIVPIPIPYVRNVASVGDLFLTAGLAFFLFATLVRAPEAAPETEEADLPRGIAGTARLPMPEATAGASAGLGVRAGTGLSPALAESMALERPMMLGGESPGFASPTLGVLSADTLTHGTSSARRSPSPCRNPSDCRCGSGSGSTRTYGSRPTRRSPHCGRDSSSACSGTGSTSSRWPSSCSRSPSRRSRWPSPSSPR